MTDPKPLTEKQKMLAGKPYKAFGEELLLERQHAKEVLFDYNALRPGEVEKRNALLRPLLGRTGKVFFIEPPFRCDYGYNISLGENFYANYNLTVLDCNRVTIGNNVLIGPNVSVFTAGHAIHPELRVNEVEYALPISIGNNVWIGGGAILNPGVSIGDNTIIGSGSVVTKDIPADVIAAGNPCRVLRPITEDDRNQFRDA
ncbi:sugar O-acetyltransferase [Paenibacillus chitinolyticus]|uniref:Acetyltransferase n=1 Tax=Paenibacillus chitinolyticus TaxID=79263 RepID=A0A410WZ39_9BACL|nr:sugar O-acetyltransferase [Paenibacillus chitinolyticus]MCY9590310.1 sugar O-acetyltransferase [Paenibacillus chitinolyticus]MCY9597006.1 sugar O-acetyltransferase [Paenibacillus chitinolyticus]QAV19698.1 sugar O-acetyltransferase [Paenibacillus chitinolyticus]